MKRSMTKPQMTLLSGRDLMTGLNSLKTTGFQKSIFPVPQQNLYYTGTQTTFNPETFKKITKRNLNFDIIETLKNIKLKDNAHLRVSIVVNRYNESEILSILDTLKDIKTIKYVQLRKVYKFNTNENDNFKEDFDAYQRVRDLISSKFNKTGNFKESEIFDVNGLSVSMWDVVFCRESIQSSGFWTNGRMTFNNLLVPGYKEIDFEMED